MFSAFLGYLILEEETGTLATPLMAKTGSYSAALVLLVEQVMTTIITFETTNWYGTERQDLVLNKHRSNNLLLRLPTFTFFIAKTTVDRSHLLVLV